jgi:membrane fusion protein (multidrug efflux system)
MSDSLKKVLAGAVIGALIVGFVWHVRNERAKHVTAFGGPGMGAPMKPSPGAGAKPGAANAGARPGQPAPSGQPGRMGGTGFSQMPTGVVVAPVRSVELKREIEALGTAKANESIDVTAKASNLVTAVRFEEGQQVRRGEVLVELDSAQARAELAIAEAAVSESRSQFRRSRELFATKALSEAQLDQLEATLKADEARVAAATARLSDTVIRAPFNGRVGLRRVSVGSLVNPGAVITTLDDSSVIKLDFTVPETFLAAIKPGQTIVAKGAAYPDEAFAGTVASIDSRVDPSTRSVTVRAMLPNEKGLLKPGMFMTVRLARGAAQGLVVSEQALVPEQGNVFVFVAKGDAAEKRLVRTGQRLVGDVEIVAGLQEGEQVVIEGTQKLRDGAPIKVLSSEPQEQQAMRDAGAGA